MCFTNTNYVVQAAGISASCMPSFLGYIKHAMDNLFSLSENADDLRFTRNYIGRTVDTIQILIRERATENTAFVIQHSVLIVLKLIA